MIDLDFTFSPADEAFRQRSPEFLARELTPDLKAAARRTTTVFADKDVAMRWQAILVRKGWAVPSWPVEHGGTDWTSHAEVHLRRRVRARPARPA